MALSDYSGSGNFTIGGNKFRSSGTSNGKTVYERMGGGSGGSNKYSSGWITAPTNTNSVTLNHNLGTDELIIEAYMAKDANGTDAHKIDLIMRITAQTAESGVGFRDVTNTALTVQAGASGWIHMNSLGQIVAGSWGTTYTHIKVLAIG
jgi:hypothetical protein